MKFIEPKWLVPEEKRQIDVKVVDDNGNKQRLIIPRDENNTDYKSLLLQYTLEQIQKNTDESVRIFRESRSRNIQREKEHAERRVNEELFLAKLEAFEMDEIKNSTNRELKRKIRKSKNKTEVLINAIVGIIDERNSK